MPNPGRDSILHQLRACEPDRRTSRQNRCKPSLAPSRGRTPSKATRPPGAHQGRVEPRGSLEPDPRPSSPVRNRKSSGRPRGAMPPRPRTEARSGSSRRTCRRWRGRPKVASACRLRLLAGVVALPGRQARAHQGGARGGGPRPQEERPAGSRSQLQHRPAAGAGARAGTARTARTLLWASPNRAAIRTTRDAGNGRRSQRARRRTGGGGGPEDRSGAAAAARGPRPRPRRPPPRPASPASPLGQEAARASRLKRPLPRERLRPVRVPAALLLREPVERVGGLAALHAPREASPDRGARRGRPSGTAASGCRARPPPGRTPGPAPRPRRREAAPGTTRDSRAGGTCRRRAGSARGGSGR